MSRNPVPRWALVLLTSGALLWPIMICVVLAVGGLLGSMGDVQGGAVLRYIALSVGVVWVINLICLLLALGFRTLMDQDDRLDS